MRTAALAAAHIVIVLLVGIVLSVLFSTILGSILGLLGFTSSVANSAAFIYALVFISFIAKMLATFISALFLRRFIAPGQGKLFATISAGTFAVDQAHSWLNADSFSLLGIVMTAVPSVVFLYITQRIVKA